MPRINRDERRNIRPGRLAALTIGATLALGGTATGAAVAAEVPVLERSQLERSLVTDETLQRYRAAYEQADRLDVQAGPNIAAGTARRPRLVAGLAALKGEVAKARVKQDVQEAKEKAAALDVGTPESVGVSQSTLDAIAACESGGSPTIVDASGTYHGKYQFDVGTWASVGGSGLPSAAPEAEQDYRAALLYSQAGASPWPVCG